MKCAAVAAWSAVLFVGVATAAYSAAQDASPPKPDQAQTARSLESLFGKTLISIDGSTIEIIASEGRFSREIVASNGAVQRSNFVFINQRLGTVADARDAQRVIGVFRASSEEILIQYGDGSTEIVRPNSESGLTIEMSSPKAATLLHVVVSRRPCVQLGRPQDGIAPICEPPGFGRFDREGGRDSGTIGLRERGPLSDRSVIDDIGTGSLTGSRGCAGTGGCRAAGGRPGHGHARCRRESGIGGHAGIRALARRRCSPASPPRAQPPQRKPPSCRRRRWWPKFR